MMRSSLRTLLGTLLLGAAAACAGDAGDDVDSDAAQAPAAAPEATPAAAPADGAALVNPNDADRETLLAVPGMTPAIVDAVIAGRPWADMLAVDAALAGQGLDEAAREEVYRRVWRPIDLNNASEEEILLIPGVGSRMAHEFDEYRPYEGMERFRREIGKYVDEAEVERLARYVEIR